MKQIEKLALEAIAQMQADAGVRLDPIAHVAAAIFFERGFMKAKEMAIEAVQDSDYDPTGFVRDALLEVGDCEQK